MERQRRVLFIGSKWVVWSEECYRSVLWSEPQRIPLELKEKTFLKQQQNQPCFIGPSVWAVRDIAEMRMWRLMNGDTLKEGMINDYIYQKKKKSVVDIGLCIMWAHHFWNSCIYGFHIVNQVSGFNLGFQKPTQSITSKRRGKTTGSPQNSCWCKIRKCFMFSRWINLHQSGCHEALYKLEHVHGLNLHTL